MAKARAILDPNFKEFLKSLNSAGVKYLLLGGYAVNYYGYHRMTDDLDVWIAVDPANAEKVSQVLREFGGFSPAKVKPSMFMERGRVFVFGREPVRIDILTSPSGVDFDACYERRQMGEIDGVAVPLVGLDDLKMNKRASGRTKDMADLENLPTIFPPPPKPKKPRRKRK